jgi:uncharacterized protein YqfA (UPF0365 family)
MDYVRYRNIQADTEMRNAIAGPDEPSNNNPVA